MFLVDSLFLRPALALNDFKLAVTFRKDIPTKVFEALHDPVVRDSAAVALSYWKVRGYA